MKCILKLRNSKSRINDYMLNEYIKFSAEKLMLLHVKVFNKIIDSDETPHIWVNGMIVSIYNI